ncbi:hypothetical protein Noc_1943 [Nitrosococcus oceani ATCC 19707]|uniref:Asparagine synthetase domain-containing protein n=2 Tax=Nitrosococcus oceani TaxID=1229 RepID=Q3J9U1_NITOC|nr:hypothetical protein Noc_1943 [Nitrosococcus oceani ATCC 19707]
MHFKYQLMSSWPCQAWLVECCKGNQEVIVYHGSRVEITPDFFCEAVWPGSYEAGGFDQTDVIAGSGGRIRNSAIIFVSSGSTVDRLNMLRGDRCVWLSNSLVCLLSAADADLNPAYGFYYKDLYSVVYGIDNCKRLLATSKGDVELVYFDNVRWDGNMASVVPKPSVNRELVNFGQYLGFLESTMEQLAENIYSPIRPKRLRMLGTLSAGYDSPTLMALASGVGCDEAICFDRTHLNEEDSGESIAGYLGVRPIVLSGTAWRHLQKPEIPFIAANSMGEEVRFSAAAETLAGRVLLTGYHGDKMWGKRTKHLGPNVVRGDPSGLGLTEFRLWAGFIHCPVPFWAVRSINAVSRISNDPEMSQWDISDEYSRPICRRIVENKGVPREAFGMKKRMASVIIHNYDEFLTPHSLQDFLIWLKEHRSAWWKRGKAPPLASAGLDRRFHRAANRYAEWAKRQPAIWRTAGWFEGKPTYLRRFIFPWAITRAKDRYGKLTSLELRK